MNKALDNCEQDVQEKMFDIISSAREELVSVPIKASTLVSKKDITHVSFIPSFVLDIDRACFNMPNMFWRDWTSELNLPSACVTILMAVRCNAS